MLQQSPSSQLTAGACQSSQGPIAPALMASGSPNTALVFTSSLANEAAQEYAQSRVRIAVFHQMHPDVQEYLSSASQNAPQCEKVLSTTPVNPSDSQPTTTTLTQEQWENRKIKIAQLEKIHSTLTKSKSASTPGVATVAAMQQQQQNLYHQNHPNPAVAEPESGASVPTTTLSVSVQPGIALNLIYLILLSIDEAAPINLNLKLRSFHLESAGTV